MTYKYEIREAEQLPKGSELWIGHKYLLILAITEAKGRLWFWQITRRRFYNAVLRQLITS